MRTLVFECPLDGFRTSPLVFQDGEIDRENVPGLHAASVQIADHTHVTHGGDDSVRFVSVELPVEDQP